MSCLRLCKNRDEEASFPKKCKPYLKNLGRSCRRKSELEREEVTQEQWPGGFGTEFQRGLRKGTLYLGKGQVKL